jgi:hypothetical protein
MKQDKKAVALWYECQQNLVKAQSRFGHDQESLVEARDYINSIYNNYYNSIDLENQKRKKNEFLEGILEVKEDISQNYKATTDGQDNWEQMEMWRVLNRCIDRKIEEGKKILETIISADIIIQYENGLETLNCLKDEVQSNIDNFVLIKNKFTKELAIKYSESKPTSNWSDRECDHHQKICSWFVQCIAENMYTEDEILEIAKLIKG